MKKIAILGSTGSIGTQTLEVIRENKDIEVTGLAAGTNVDLLEKQIREFQPKLVAMWTEEKAKELKSRIRDLDVKVVSGDPCNGDRGYDRYPSDNCSDQSRKGYCPCK